MSYCTFCVYLTHSQVSKTMFFYPGLLRSNHDYFLSGVISGMVFPMVIAAHPTELNQIALGMSDGSVNVIEPSDAEQKWGVCSPFENGGGGSGSGPIAPLPLIPPNQSLNNNNNPTSEPPTR